MLLKLAQGKQQSLFSIKALYSKSVKNRDTGESYSVFTGNVEGYDVAIADTSPDTIKFVEAAARPASSRHMMSHLIRLAAHKPIGGKNDEMRISIILEDLSIELDGLSEFAVAQCCSEFKKSKESDFFPKTHEFLSRAEMLTDHYAKLFKGTGDLKIAN